MKGDKKDHTTSNGDRKHSTQFYKCKYPQY